jgi:hypothetical protein
MQRAVLLALRRAISHACKAGTDSPEHWWAGCLAPIAWLHLAPYDNRLENNENNEWT